MGTRRRAKPAARAPRRARAPPLRLGRLPGLAGLSPARLLDGGVGKRRGK